MPAPTKQCAGSPDITTLSYSILYDISGAIPTIILTNLSTVINPTLLTWWYIITTPSGTPVHSGSVTSPDVSNVAWTTLQIASGTWPTNFGNPPCGQVEFAPNAPYICTLYVKDSSSNIFSLAITQTITRPNGNTSNSCGNFGQAAVTVQVKCNDKVVYCADSTGLSYNNILVPDTQTNNWILVYPLSPTGSPIDNGTASNSPYVNFPIGYSGDGYVLNFLEYCTYDMGNGASVKLQYKAINPQTGGPGLPFAVLCNIDLCKLQCQISAFCKLSKSKCGVLEDTALTSKMTRMNLLFNQAIIGIIQPLCGIDVPVIIKEIQKIGDLDDNCNCGCSDTGINFSYPTSPGNATGGCCPVSSDVIDSETDEAPAACPGSYFPAQVLDPTGQSVIGTVSDINAMVGLLNATSSWQAYGIAFAEGNCKIGWFPATGAGTIPDVQVVLLDTPSVLPIVVAVIDADSTSPPANCPGSYFPAYLYKPDGTTLIGNVNNITALINAINADPDWNAYGVAAYNGSNCTVVFQPNTGITSIPDIMIKIDAGCVGGTINLPISLSSDLCTADSLLSPSSFPIILYVDWGLGVGFESLGVINDKASLINALNGDSNKPSVVTVADNALVFADVIVNASDCTYTQTPIITGTPLGSGYLFLGPNHSNLLNIPSSSKEIALDITAVTRLGVVPGGVASQIRWHSIRVGNYLIDSESTTGKIRFYDVINPLTPTLVSTVTLNNVSGTCFTGVPTSIWGGSGLTASYYSLYFPTDYCAAMDITAIYVVEAVTGSIWKINMGGVVASFQDNKLLGKCPRVLLNGKLFFTQDGNLEDYTTSSGVAMGDIVILDLGTFNAGGLSTATIFLNTLQNVWAASYDGIDTIYFTGTDANAVSGATGSIAKYTVSSATVAARYLHALPGSNLQKRANTSFAAGVLYFAIWNMASVYGTFAINSADIGTTNTPHLFPTPPGTLSSVNPLNIKPIGNCMIAITYSVPNNAGGYIAIFHRDAYFINKLHLNDSEEVYNVIPFLVGSYTPNSFV